MVSWGADEAHRQRHEQDVRALKKGDFVTIKANYTIPKGFAGHPDRRGRYLHPGRIITGGSVGIIKSGHETHGSYAAGNLHVSFADTGGPYPPLELPPDKLDVLGQQVFGQKLSKGDKVVSKGPVFENGFRVAEPGAVGEITSIKLNLEQSKVNVVVQFPKGHNASRDLNIDFQNIIAERSLDIATMVPGDFVTIEVDGSHEGDRIPKGTLAKIIEITPDQARVVELLVNSGLKGKQMSLNKEHIKKAELVPGDFVTTKVWLSDGTPNGRITQGTLAEIHEISDGGSRDVTLLQTLGKGPVQGSRFWLRAEQIEIATASVPGDFVMTKSAASRRGTSADRTKVGEILKINPDGSRKIKFPHASYQGGRESNLKEDNLVVVLKKRKDSSAEEEGEW